MNAETSPLRKRIILWVLALTVLAVTMDLSILNVALTTIQRELHTSSAALQWAVDSYMITFAAFIFTGGVTADRFGRRKVLVIALLLFGGSSGMAAVSNGVGQLIVWRAIMGIGAAGLPTISLAILLGIFPPAERQKAIAVWAAAAGVGSATGPALGGVLLHFFWWGSILLVNVPLVLVVVPMILWLVPESRNPKFARFDPAGVLISVAAVGALVYGIVYGGEHSDWLGAQTLGPIVGGVALLGLLVAVETRTKEPALDMALLRSARFSAGTVAIALAFFALLGGGFITSVYFQAVRGLSPLNGGLLTIPMGVAGFLISFRIPKLVKRFGPRHVVMTGTLLMTATYVFYATAGRTTPLWLFAVAQFVLGLGWGSVMAPSTGALMSVVPPVKAGAGQAMSNTVRQVAGALGVAAVGSVLGVGYRAAFDSGLLPAAVRGQGSGSVGGTLYALDQTGAQLGSSTLASVKDSAFNAYMHGMHPAMIVCGVFALGAAAVAWRGLPVRPAAPAGAPAAPTPAAQPAPAKS